MREEFINYWYLKEDLKSHGLLVSSTDECAVGQLCPHQQMSLELQGIHIRFRRKGEFLQEDNFISACYSISANGARKARLWGLYV